MKFFGSSPDTPKSIRKLKKFLNAKTPGLGSIIGASRKQDARRRKSDRFSKRGKVLQEPPGRKFR